MPDCVFCKIVAGQIPATKVWEDDAVIAFRDLNPAAPTHVLIVPRVHAADLTTTDAPTAARVIAAVPVVAGALGLKDYRVVVNNGAGAGQSVFHLHVHLLGGRKFSWPPG